MALPLSRIGSRMLVAVRPLARRSTGTSSAKSTQVLHDFQGVKASFCWDHQNGFGITNDGQLVIIAPESDVNITTTPSVENDPMTKAILEMAKETYKEQRHTWEDHEEIPC